MIGRSLLFVPGDSEKKIAKGLASDADAIILDLEDSVAPGNKAQARGLAAETLSQKRRPKSLWVRVNPLDTELALPDLAVIAAEAPDGIILPKCDGPGQIVRLAHYLDALETQAGHDVGAIRLLPLVTETPTGVFAAGSYANASPRLAGLTWGAEDLAAAIGAASNRDETGQFAFTFRLARSLCLIGAHAAGVEAIETVFTDFRDLDGLAAYARQGRREGFTGMMAIHPDQAAVINEAFTPSSEEIAHAREVVHAFEAQPGAGVVALCGKMLDRPHQKQALRVLAVAERLAGR